MAEFTGGNEKNFSVGEPVVFENKTESKFEVCVGVVFHKSGIYQVSIVGNRTIVSEVMKQKTGKWNFIGDQMFECTECGVCYTQNQFHQMMVRITDPEFPKFCPNCGADMRGEQE